MPSTSLVKFMGQSKTASGDPIHWGRVDRDGLPTRGNVPAMTEEEMQLRLTRAADPQVKTFDMSVPEERQEYMFVMDKITNGWAQGIYVDRQFVAEEKKWLVYIEWADWYMQDGAPMHSQNPYVGRLNDE